MNQITIVGNLGQDAEQKLKQDNTPYWIINIATTRRWLDKTTNEKKSETTWHRVTLYGNYQNLVPYLRKGTCVCVSGEQRNVVYDIKDNNGNVLMNGQNPIKNTLSYIVCKSIELVGGASQPQQQQQNNTPAPAPAPAQNQQQNNYAPQNGDLPF